MSTREQIVSLLDSVPEDDLRSVLILVQGLAIPHEDYVERALDEADAFAETNTVYYTRDEFNERIRGRYHD
jgi:hypothetical protein